MVRFSICKKPLEDEIALSLMEAPPKGFPTRPVPLLGIYGKIAKGNELMMIYCATRVSACDCEEPDELLLFGVESSRGGELPPSVLSDTLLRSLAVVHFSRLSLVFMSGLVLPWLVAAERCVTSVSADSRDATDMLRWS